MGKQLQLYLTPRDIAELEEAVRLEGGIILLRNSSDPHPSLAKTALVVLANSTAVDGCLVRDCDLGNVVFFSVPGQQRWVVDSLRSHVIEFFGCNFDGKTLKRGRLFYDRGFYSAAGTWVEKPKAFQDWVTQTFRLGTKMFGKDRTLDAIVGRDAREWRSKTSRKFMPLSFVSPSESPADT